MIEISPLGSSIHDLYNALYSHKIFRVATGEEIEIDSIYSVERGKLT
jgi:hypothetical protein